MKILFLGSVVTPAQAEALSGTSVAGNKMQYCLLKRLSEFEDVHIDAISVKCRAAFPRDKRLWQHREELVLTDRVKGYFAGYCNFPIIKQIWHTLSVYHEARRYIRRHGRPDVVLSFNMFPQTGFTMKRLKQWYHIPTATLLADLPIDDAASRSGVMRFCRRLFDRLTERYIAGCDNIIALNKNAVEIYHPGADYVVVDGAIDLEPDYTPPKIQVPAEKRIVFEGSLTKYNGVVQLVEAMDYVADKSVVLDIYGDGDMREFVRAASENNRNIVYHGRVSSEALGEIYNHAWLLINPRPIDDAISQVTFPSKIFEYLLSGTPVLSTRLSGFSEEYDKIMFFAEGDDARSIGESINTVAQLPAKILCQAALNAQSFVVNSRTWQKQSARIKDFLLTLL